MQKNHIPAASGLWLPVITPFNDGQLDTSSLTRLINHYSRQPLNGFIVAATTGESLTLNDEETEKIVSIAAEAVAGRIPIFLGLSGSNTAKLLEFIQYTADWSINGYLISCPYYSRPSQQGLYQHFSALANATQRPLMLYNIPYRTGVNLLNDTLLELAEIPNIVGLKDCCADQGQTFDLLKRKPKDFSVLTGEDAQYYSALVHGVDGAILASAHVATERFVSICESLQAEDQKCALSHWKEIEFLTRLLFAEPSPAGIKYWLWRDGLIDSPELRLPMTGVSREHADRLDIAMRQMKCE